MTAVNAALRGKKKVDLFECARVDHTRPIEDIIRDLSSLVEEGLFSHIGMSECSAETLRRANAVHPITAVEIEVSPWSIEEETKKGKLRVNALERLNSDESILQFWQLHNSSTSLWQPTRESLFMTVTSSYRYMTDLASDLSAEVS